MASSSTSFVANKTVLVTGATTGLGIEAAKKLASLGVSHLIITARSDAKGHAAKKEIETYLLMQPHKSKAKTASVVITPLVLDMSSSAGVETFVSTLTEMLGSEPLHAAVLNAGTMQTKHVLSPDNFEETIQVNTISTLLLALLLLPLLLSAAGNIDSTQNPNTNAKTGAPYKPHLTIVSSTTAYTLKSSSISNVETSPDPVAQLCQPKNFIENFNGARDQYARSKMLLEWGVRHIARLPSLKSTLSGSPRVIVNSVCPGMCKSDLGRQMVKNPLVKVVAWGLFTFVAKTAEEGAQDYMDALGKGDESMGRMWRKEGFAKGGECLDEEGMDGFGDRVWAELRLGLERSEEGVVRRLE